MKIHLLLLLVFNFIYSITDININQIEDSKVYKEHISLSLDETMINDFLKQILPIKDKGEKLLILVLTGGITLHYWERLFGWLPMAPDSLHTGSILIRIIFGMLAIALPILAGLSVKSKWFYSYIPILWGLWLARYLPLGMVEGGTILPFGFPQWSADENVIGFCQNLIFVFSWLCSLILLRRFIINNWWSLAKGSLVLSLLALTGHWLVVL